MGASKIDPLGALKNIERKLIGGFKNAFIDDTSPASAERERGRTPSINDLERFGDRFNMSSIFPYESYDKETGIYFNRDTVGFVLYCIPATGLDVSTLKVLNGIFSMSHRANTSIQVSLYADPNIDSILERWSSFGALPEGHEFKEMLNLLAKNRCDYLKKAKWSSMFPDEAALIKNCHLMFSYTIPVPDDVAPVDMDNQEIEFLVRTRESIKGILKSSNIPAQSMNPDTLIRIMDGLVNPDYDAKRKLKYDEDNLLNTQIVDSETRALWGAGVSSIIHKEHAFSVLPFHVRQFPTVWPGFKNGELIGSFSNSILRLACPFIATLTVNVPDQISEKSVVTKKQMRATQMSTSPIAKYVPQWADRKKDWDYAAGKVDEGNKMLEAFYQIVLIAPEGKEREVEQSAKGLYDSFGWVLTRSRYTPIHSFLGAIPMGVCKDTLQALKKFGHYSKRLSWTCTNLAPWIGEYKGSKTPLMLLSSRKGQLSFFDNFDNDQGNYNVSTIATSGGGKSFLTQELVQRTITADGRVFIIDSGHSYRRLCKLMNGSYIDFAKVVPGLNPFSGIKPDDEGLINDQMPLLKMLLECMCSPYTPLGQEEKATLEMAILKAWKRDGNKANPDTVRDMLSEDIDEVTGNISSVAGALKRALFSYSSEGVYAKYFSGVADIDLNSRFVVLDLDGLKSTPDLQSVVLLILMMRITQAMYLGGSRSQRKLCIIDEAWRLLSKGHAGDFIEEGYRVARKYGGCFMTITQKISDYFQSETAKAAYMNSDFIIYLRQKPEALLAAERDKHIDNSDGKVDILRGLQTSKGRYSELAIQSPNGLSVHRFYVDPVTAMLFSTSAEDLDLVDSLVAEGNTIIESCIKAAKVRSLN